MNRAFLLRAIVFLLLLSVSCKDEPVKPPDNTPKPGKRDYTWTVDTLSYPGSFQTLMRDIWASSATDVYVVGHNDQNRGQMYRYNGVIWSPIRLAISDGGNIAGGFDFTAIYGFNANDIYAVGSRIYSNPTPPPNFLDSSIVIHWNGSQWREVRLPQRGRRLTAIWGSSPRNVWFGGMWGTLYHYDGASVRKIPFDSLSGFSYMAGFSSSDVFATGSRKIDFESPEDSLFRYLYRFDGESWNPIDSFEINPNHNIWRFGASLWVSEKWQLYSALYGVFLLEGNSWRQLLDSDWPLRMAGSAENNLFAVGDLGRVFHWNGSDWKRLSEAEGHAMLYTAVWTNNVETFIIGHDARRTFIVHGK